MKLANMNEFSFLVLLSENITRWRGLSKQVLQKIPKIKQENH